MISKLFAGTVTQVDQTWDDTATRTYQIQPFTKVYLEGSFKVILEQGNQVGLRIKTDEDNFKYIDVVTDAQSLTLKITKKHFDFDELILYITFKELTDLEIEGGICIETKGYINLKDFKLKVQGGAVVEMNLKVQKFHLSGEGGVKMQFDGIADELIATLSGAGYLNSLELKTRNVDVKIEGIGAASVFATDKLIAFISGFGKINYRGDPEVIKKIEGVGSVSHD
jgi:hypothetical protein